MQEELLQQSVENSKLQHTNETLTKQLSKTEDKSANLQANVTSLTEDNLKVRNVQLFSYYITILHTSHLVSHAALTCENMFVS